MVIEVNGEKYFISEENYHRLKGWRKYKEENISDMPFVEWYDKVFINDESLS